MTDNREDAIEENCCRYLVKRIWMMDKMKELVGDMRTLNELMLTVTTCRLSTCLRQMKDQVTASQNNKLCWSQNGLYR